MKEQEAHSNVIAFPKEITSAYQQKIKKQKEKQIQRIRLSGFIFIGCLLLLSMGYQTYHNYVKLKETKQQLDEVIVLEETNYTKRLIAQDELDRLSNPEYLLDLARRDLFYSKPGEVLFDIPTHDSQVSTP